MNIRSRHIETWNIVGVCVPFWKWRPMSGLSEPQQCWTAISIGVMLWSNRWNDSRFGENRDFASQCTRMVNVSDDDVYSCGSTAFFAFRFFYYSFLWFFQRLVVIGGVVFRTITAIKIRKYGWKLVIVPTRVAVVSQSRRHVSDIGCKQTEITSRDSREMRDFSMTSHSLTSRFARFYDIWLINWISWSCWPIGFRTAEQMQLNLFQTRSYKGNTAVSYPSPPLSMVCAVSNMMSALTHSSIPFLHRWV